MPRTLAHAPIRIPAHIRLCVICVADYVPYRQPHMTLYEIDARKRKLSPSDCLSSTLYSFRNTIICALHMRAGVDMPARENLHFRSNLHRTCVREYIWRKNFALLIIFTIYRFVIVLQCKKCNIFINIINNCYKNHKLVV